MTVPRPSSPGAHSEEELLEQWEFLDRLVERQANLLRAGVQDSEEPDDPGPAPSALDELERHLESTRVELAAAEAARRAAERRAEELDRRLIATTAELQRTQRAHTDALAALRSAHLETQGLRERLERRRRWSWPFRRP
jgi:chromosome segregation ATPase